MTPGRLNNIAVMHHETRVWGSLSFCMLFWRMSLSIFFSAYFLSMEPGLSSCDLKKKPRSKLSSASGLSSLTEMASQEDRGERAKTLSEERSRLYIAAD